MLSVFVSGDSQAENAALLAVSDAPSSTLNWSTPALPRLRRMREKEEGACLLALDDAGHSEMASSGAAREQRR